MGIVSRDTKKKFGVPNVDNLFAIFIQEEGFDIYEKTHLKGYSIRRKEQVT